MRLMTLAIAVFCLATSSMPALSAGQWDCSACHRPDPAGRGALPPQVAGCIGCHPGTERILGHAMSLRTGERQFVDRTYRSFDNAFWTKNCDSCHVAGCFDCHGDLNRIRKPDVATCQRCHKGYYIGWDFSGRAPREDNNRYQRGIEVAGETFLKMSPDVHYQAGMACGDCHSMASLAAGKRSSKGCRDCHTPDTRIIEHRITAHLEKMECFACHAAWSAQEYGTFYLRFRDKRVREEFDLRSGPADDYLKSSYLKRQDAPPLGINSRGLVSPIRPQFIVYYTDILAARNSGPENTLLAAEWRAYFPHTVQRGTAECNGCHGNPARFLLEPEQDRIFQLRQDGMGLDSFWSQHGQKMVNGRFMDMNQYSRLQHNDLKYKKAYIEKWQRFLKRGALSSSH